MKLGALPRTVALGLGLVCSLQGAELPAPILAWDFEKTGRARATMELGGKAGPMAPILLSGRSRPKVLAGLGVGYSRCIDFRPPAAPALYRSDAIAQVLDGARQVTVCFWLRGVKRPAPEGREFLLSSPPLTIFLHEKTKGYPALDLRGDVGKGVLWATRHSEAISPDRWSFYAFTYDADMAEDNCLSYSGSDASPLRLTWTASGSWGGLAPMKDGTLVLGAGDARGEGALSGLGDGIRVYADILSGTQLEALRLKQLGPEWERERVRQKAKLAADRQREQARREKRFSGSLALVPIDPLSQVYPDRLPAPLVSREPLGVPGGGFVSLQFALRSDTGGRCRLRLEPPSHRGRALGGEGVIYQVVSVPVEANTNGGSRTAIGRRPPAGWMKSFVREAPFRVGEVLRVVDEIVLKAGETASVALVLPVPRDAPAGLYRGHLVAEFGTRRERAQYGFQVHKVAVASPSALAVSYWLSPAPVDLTSETPPEWWSKEHWALIEGTARNLRAFGQTHVLTPVIKGEYPLTDVVRKKDGGYTFAFDRFDRWVELFLASDYQGIQGHHVTLWGAIHGLDEATGKRGLLLRSNAGEEYARFLAAFFTALRGHLAGKDWLDIYEQHLIDECSDVPRYRELQALARKHLAGVRIVDAINRHPEELSKLVDVPVLSIQYAEKLRVESQAWRQAGKRVWYYNCCSPIPPMPNRHLDESLVCSRLYPWYGWLFGAEGYLNWGGNIYRGADPYATSVGPVPSGSQNPGHPPGDNWHYYPTPGGLVPGLRMLAFREGLLDHALLVMLAERDPVKAKEITGKLTTGLRSYSRKAADYHAARRELLRALAR